MIHQVQEILVIDDDDELCAVIKAYLEQYDFKVCCYYTPSTAYNYLQTNMPQLILLDVMLPEEDGFSVCQKLQQHMQSQANYIPIIMLSARGDVFDRIVGLEMGANDYLPKPFEPRELLARIRSTLRLYENARPAQIHNIKTRQKGLLLNQHTQQVSVDGELIELTAMEYSLLCLLHDNPDSIVSRDQIMDKLRGTSADIYSRTIDALVTRLRRKLHDNPQTPRFIKTVWGRGYQLLRHDVIF